MSSKTLSNSTDKISDFGRRLKESFDNSTNQSIAEKLGVSKPALTAYMQGRIPPPDKLIEIAKLTKCNLNWLLTGIGTKKNNPQIERPQGLIIQGNKGGIGTSTSAVMISANLALRGYGVLIAADVLHTCAHLLLSNQVLKSDKMCDRRDEQYISTRNKNLDFFIPSYWKREYPEEITKSFSFDYSEINKRYQFIIFDVQRTEDPFTYPHYSLMKTSYLEPILKNAQVLMAYQPFLSFTEQVESTLEYAKMQQMIYPDADFLGAFIINRWKVSNQEKADFIESVDELKGIIGAKLFNTQIEFYNELNANYKELEKKIFSRKTRVFENYTILVNEILAKLGMDVND